VRRFGGVVIVMAMMLLPIACNDDASSTTGTEAPAVQRVLAVDNEFRPQSLTVPAGTEVVFENTGRLDHNVVPVNDPTASEWGVLEVDFAPADTYSHVFTTPGTYAYYCTIHGSPTAGMRGTVVVTESDGTPVTDTVAATTSTQPAGPVEAIEVPADQPTIQAAVDAAAAGDLILVSPGTYHEAVQVATDRLTIRGLERNTVVLDGQLEMDTGIRVLGAAGVTIENMTAMNYTKNGFFWTGVTGYRGSYLTTYRTGDYGVYSYDSVDGQLDHLYTVGSVDAGVYIGGCFPCNTVLTDSVSEYNGIGYSGTNAGGDLFIVNSVFRNNRVGMLPNSGTYELCYPQRNTTIVGNVIFDNNEPDTPSIRFAVLAQGNGIIISGGVQNVIERNRVVDHDMAGVALLPFLEYDPNDEQPPRDEWSRTCAEQRKDRPNDPGTAMLWDAFDNRVVGNVFADNRLTDLLVASASGDSSELGNCFADNTFTASVPDDVETLAPCDGKGVGAWPADEFDAVEWLSASSGKGPDWRTVELPELTAQENMPNVATAPAHPATDTPFAVDLAAIEVPPMPSR